MRLSDFYDEKEEYQRKLHSIMAMIGGFLGAYAILTRMDLFGNAQTTNVMYIVLEIFGRDLKGVLLRILGTIIYMSGVASTVIWKKYMDINIHYAAIGIDMIAIGLLGFIPQTVNPVISLYPIFFSMAFQWNAFPGAYGYVSASIFSTNNIRQMTLGLAEYFTGHDMKQLHKASIYARVLLFYHIGVALSYISVVIAGVRGVWFGTAIVVVALIKIIGEDRNRQWAKTEMKPAER